MFDPAFSRNAILRLNSKPIWSLHKWRGRGFDFGDSIAQCLNFTGCSDDGIFAAAQFDGQHFFIKDWS